MSVNVEIEFVKGRKRRLTDVVEIENPAILVYKDSRGLLYGFPTTNVRSVKISLYSDGAAV